MFARASKKSIIWMNAGPAIRLWLWLAVFMTLIVSNASVFAQAIGAASGERITTFRSEVFVQQNGGIRVIEDIHVEAQGELIKRGIYRDFPLVTMNALKFYDLADIQIESILLDGRIVPYHTEKLDGAIRIYMGDPQRTLSIGEHKFTITYFLNNQISLGEGVDELYWNVTGNDWQFSIDIVDAKVHLPVGAEVNDLAVYVGPQGQKGGRYEVLSGAGNFVEVRNAVALSKGDGLTIAVSWPSGYVSHPAFVNAVGKLVSDNLGIFIGMTLCLLLLVYLTFSWRKFGKDPKPPTVVPRFEPPVGRSAAEVGFLWCNAKGGQNFATKAFAVVLTSLAVKRCLTISVTGKGEYILSKLPGVRDDLPDDEQTVLNSLLRQSDVKEITIGREYRKEVESARNSLLNRYSAAQRSGYFVRNDFPWKIGFVMAVLAVAAVVMLDPVIGARDPESFIGTAIGSIMLVGAIVLIFNFLQAILAGIVDRGKPVERAIGKLVIVSLGFMAPAWVFGFILLGAMSPVALCVAVFAIVVCCLFRIWMEVPTQEFLKLHAEIEGYRRYLTVAEQDRMNFMNREMGDAIAIFEKHLPFAMALDAEDVWTQRFEDYLRSLPSEADGRNKEYNPAWYRDGRGWQNIGSFSSSSVGQLSAAAVSFGAPTISSAGIASGGGGFSGGGRGGGGGGGW
ncbi:DUF2207 domain-containing protein [Thalassospira sp. SM2505]